MDLIKIGKFIALHRKEKGLTQEELASKLAITNRAVSKWERGLSLPDAAIMLDLCHILDINVNELLMGEKIKMEEEKKKTEELLIEMAKQQEENNKRTYITMWIMGIVISIFYITLVIVSCLMTEKGVVLGVIVGFSTVIFIGICFYLIKMEIDAGYYECQKCHHKFVPTYWQATIAPHMINTRFLKCPKCSKKSWARKVMK